MLAYILVKVLHAHGWLKTMSHFCSVNDVNYSQYNFYESDSEMHAVYRRVETQDCRGSSVFTINF